MGRPTGHRTAAPRRTSCLALGLAGGLLLLPAAIAHAQSGATAPPPLEPPPLVPGSPNPFVPPVPPPVPPPVARPLALPVAPAVATPAPPPTAVPGAYDDAQTLLAQKRYARAAEKLREVTASRPDFAPGWFALALAARRAGHCTDAIPAYQRYAALQPADAEPYFGLGLCLRDTGDRAAAVTALRRFLELERRPGQEKWIEIARSLVATLEAPAPAALGRGAAAYEAAQRLRDAGKIEAALKRFGEAAAFDPDLMAARAAWGELLIKVHREADAAVVLHAAVERNPQYPLAWYELAFALREVGRFGEAVDAYRRYIALRPKDPDPHYGLARALQKMGRDDEAARSFATYVAMENRPGEQRWVVSAKAEVAARDRARVSPTSAASTPSGPPTDRAPAPPR